MGKPRKGAPIGATLNCRNCDTEFVRDHPRRLYCSASCRTRYDERVLSQTPERRAVELEKNRRINRRRTPLTPEQVRRRQLGRRYGITPEQWEAMFDAQGRKCYFGCETAGPFGRWATDHDHETGKVRAILCVKHNTLIGYLEKSADDLPVLFQYIDHFKNNLT